MYIYASFYTYSPAGSFSFPTCSAASFTFTPNQEMIDLGYTALSYSLVRILTPGSPCPTLEYDLE